MSMKSSFNKKAETYNKAAKTETARLADFFKSSFEPKVAVPQRPCPPTRPDAWNGFNLDYQRYLDGSTKLEEKASS